MINHITNDSYLQDGIRKQLIIEYGEDLYITNEKIHFEQFSLTESISAETELKFGGCEASMVEFRVTSDVESLKDKWLKISQILNDNYENPFVIGYYKVNSDKLTADKKNRDIIAYDSMFYLVNTEISDWYNGFLFPVTLGFFRKKLFEMLEFPQEEIELPLDDVVLRASTYLDELYAGDVLKDICALNGRMGRINRDGIFVYTKLSSADDEADYTLTKNRYKQGNLQYEDYSTTLIEGVYFIQNSSNTSVVYGMGYDNLYPLELTSLYISDDIDVLREIAIRFFEQVKNVQYTPFSVSGIGNPCVECGDKIDVVVNRDKVISTYVLERKLKGIQNLTDEYTADGTEYYEYLNSSSTSSANKTKTAMSRETVGSYTFTNATNIEIKQADVTIIQYNVAATSDTDVIFMATIPITTDNDGELILNYTIDAVRQEYSELRQYLHKGNNIVTVTNYFKMNKNARMTLSLTARLEYIESVSRQHTAQISALNQYINSGAYTEVAVDTTPPNGTIAQEGIRSVIIAKGINKGGEWDGTINIAEEFGIVDFNYSVELSEMTDVIGENRQEPQSDSITQLYSVFSIGDVEVVGMTENVQII